MTTVSEEAIIRTFGFIWDRLKIIVEPSSAVALAPLFDGAYQGQNKRVGIIISGGNLDINNPIISATLLKSPG
jgi:threonine dehydratase